jgi:hypothetical protein
MVQKNLPLDLFSSLVDLIVELGGDHTMYSFLARIKKGRMQN